MGVPHCAHETCRFKTAAGYPQLPPSPSPTSDTQNRPKWLQFDAGVSPNLWVCDRMKDAP